MASNLGKGIFAIRQFFPRRADIVIQSLRRKKHLQLEENFSSDSVKDDNLIELRESPLILLEDVKTTIRKNLTFIFRKTKKHSVEK